MGEEIYGNVSDIVEILNNTFCEAFTKEETFIDERVNVVNEMLTLLLLNVIQKKIINNNVNKSVGDPIFDMVKTSIGTGKTPKKWKRADIMRILLPFYRQSSGYKSPDL